MTTALEVAQHYHAQYPDRQYAYSRDELMISVYNEQDGCYRPILERRTLDTDWNLSGFVMAPAAEIPAIDWVPL